MTILKQFYRYDYNGMIETVKHAKKTVKAKHYIDITGYLHTNCFLFALYIATLRNLIDEYQIEESELKDFKYKVSPNDLPF